MNEMQLEKRANANDGVKNVRRRHPLCYFRASATFSWTFFLLVHSQTSAGK